MYEANELITLINQKIWFNINRYPFFKIAIKQVIVKNNWMYLVQSNFCYKSFKSINTLVSNKISTYYNEWLDQWPKHFRAMSSNENKRG